MIKSNKRHFGPFESPNWSLLVKPESKSNRDTRQFFAETVDTTRLVKRKSPKADIKLQHKKVYELSLAITLALLIASFQLGRQYSLAPASISTTDVIIEVADIPATKQYRKAPPPARPSVPVPSGGEELIPEDETIEPTVIDFSDIPLPPAPSLGDDDELAIFVAYDEPAQIIGGLGAIQKHLKYPSFAWKTRTAGTVFVRVLVGVDGRTEKMEIIKAKPTRMGFEEAAMEALKKVRWEPAMQREKKIRVWATILVQFSLAS